MEATNSNKNTKSKGKLKKFYFLLKFLEIRLRFIIILIVTGLLVGYWDHVQNYWERWTRHQAKAHEGAAQQETEYFCPMHPFVIRNVPGSCPICGMNLVPRKKTAAVELPEGVLSRLQVSPQRIVQAGVQVEEVKYRLLSRKLRSYGVVDTAETNMARLIARFPGRVEQLMVNATGVQVKKGDPLARIYSQKFLAAAEEYRQALERLKSVQGVNSTPDEKQRAEMVADYAKQRLSLAGFTDEQLNSIARTGKVPDYVTLYSPLSGTILEKNVLLGQSLEEGASIYTIADLSTLWLQIWIIESDISAVRVGMPVEITNVAYPGMIFFGTVDFIYPTLNPENRSMKVRVVVNNQDGKLKPGMYATAVLTSPVGKYGEIGTPSDPLKTIAQTSTRGPASSAKKVKLPTQTQEDAKQFIDSLPQGAAYYQCPMDLEVVSDKPGKCPKCGMNLEEVKPEPKTKDKTNSVTSSTHPTHVPETTQVETPTQSMDEARKLLSNLPEGSKYYQCSMDPEVVSDHPGNCPKCGMKLDEHTKVGDKTSFESVEQWAEGWTCPMHLDQLQNDPGKCQICGCAMKLTKWRVQRVLSVPEMAVIDTGSRKIVYVESSPGVFDAKEVVLGARAGDYYPVLEGLKPGEKIVAQGAFLIDAETRLSPGGIKPAASDAAKPEEARAQGTHAQHGM